jgi:hypothetical protein
MARASQILERGMKSSKELSSAGRISQRRKVEDK